MNTEDVLNEFRDAGALREGHFVLSSGLHSPVFLQKNLVFMDGARCARLCKALAEKIVATVGPVDAAISPAVGGIIPGYETAKHLNVRSMYVEREGGEFKLIPILLLLLATLMYAISTTTVKSKLSDIPAKILSAFVFSFVLILPSVIALVFAGFFNNIQVNSSLWEGIGFVSLLSIFGTGLAMMLNYRLLSVSTPLFASTVTLLMPVVAIIWGLLDGEKLTLMQGFGGVIILAGLIFLRQMPAAQK